MVRDKKSDKLYSNILVTGCGGDIGLGIGKILKSIGISKRVIGCDIHENHPGTEIFDECLKISRADNHNYLNDLSIIIKKYSIDLIIPTSESEIRVFFEKEILEKFESAKVLLANNESLRLGLDKLETIKFLEKNKFIFPWTFIVKERDPISTPCVIKSRFSQGSKSFKIVKKEEISIYKKERPEDIWQELLLPDEEEYTCGLYRTLDDEIRTIIFRRKLQGGLTGSGEVVNNKAIEKMLFKLGNAINLRGSINVQLRLTQRGPVIFEINSRFSSTVVFRHLIGFKDLVWALQERLGIKIEKYTPPKEGTKIFRGTKEYILPPKD